MKDAMKIDCNSHDLSLTPEMVERIFGFCDMDCQQRSSWSTRFQSFDREQHPLVVDEKRIVINFQFIGSSIEQFAFSQECLETIRQRHEEFVTRVVQQGYIGPQETKILRGDWRNEEF